MNKTAVNVNLTKSDEVLKNEGYKARAEGKDMVKDNPYPSSDDQHWKWRAGYLEAFKDEGGGF